MRALKTLRGSGSLLAPAPVPETVPVPVLFVVLALTMQSTGGARRIHGLRPHNGPSPCQHCSLPGQQVQGWHGWRQVSEDERRSSSSLDKERPGLSTVLTSYLFATKKKQAGRKAKAGNRFSQLLRIVAAEYMWARNQATKDAYTLLPSTAVCCN